MGSKTSRGEDSLSFPGALRRLRAYLCGDRHMVGAYPPEWQARPPAVAPEPAVSDDASATAPAVIPLRAASPAQVG